MAAAVGAGLSLTAIVLILISVTLHTGWNFFSKRRQPNPAMFLVANTIGALPLLPVVFLYYRALPYFPAQVWWMAIATGFFQAGYYVGLAGAYRSGDLSVAYPLVRTLPILFVTGITFLLGRGEQLSLLYGVGVVMIIAGIFLLPMQRFGGINWRNYWNLTCLFALFAACGTAGYSMLDDTALRVLRSTPGIPYGKVELTLMYTVLSALCSSAWLAVYVLARRIDRAELRHTLQNGMWEIFGIGVVIYAAYTLVLIAMNYATNVSYVVTFRQLSIPLGAALGMVILDEPRYPPKMAGIALTFAGLVLVGLG